ncbi:unnamed protein product, partial [Laminaria digitata]
ERCAEAVAKVARVEGVFRRAKSVVLQVLLDTCRPDRSRSTSSSIEFDRRTRGKLGMRGGGGGEKNGSASSLATHTVEHAQQAIAYFLLSDPEDEALWDGILYPPTPPTRTASAAASTT